MWWWMIVIWVVWVHSYNNQIKVAVIVEVVVGIIGVGVLIRKVVV